MPSPPPRGNRLSEYHIAHVREYSKEELWNLCPCPSCPSCPQCPYPCPCPCPSCPACACTFPIDNGLSSSDGDSDEDVTESANSIQTHCGEKLTKRSPVPVYPMTAWDFSCWQIHDVVGEMVNRLEVVAHLSFALLTAKAAAIAGETSSVGVEASTNADAYVEVSAGSCFQQNIITDGSGSAENAFNYKKTNTKTKMSANHVLYLLETKHNLELLRDDILTLLMTKTQ